MKCQVCRIKEAETLSIVCSDRCDKIRLKIIELSDRYTPTPGCENCHGDLGVGCTTECINQFQAARSLISELYSLVRIG